jgi:imidazolonepropionase
MKDKPVYIRNTSQVFTGVTEARGESTDVPGRGIIENGCVLVWGEKIIDVGTDGEVRKRNPRLCGEWTNFDAGGKLLMPGFVDPHTHPVFGRTREKEFVMRIRGASYREIAESGGGIRSSVRDLREYSEEALLALLLKRLDTFLLYGTTTLEAKSGYGLSMEGEMKSLRVIARAQEKHPVDLVPTFLGAHEVPDEYRTRREDYISIVKEEMLPAVKRDNMAKFCDIFCEEGVFSVEESRDILSAARELGFELKLHADELSASGGAELSAELGAFSADHLVRTSFRGIAMMAEKGVIPVLLPGTSFFLRSDRYAPAREMIEAGLKVAIATDFNPGSSMTESMQIITTIASLFMGMTPFETLVSSTGHSAMAIGMADAVGTLEKGKYADIVLMDVGNIESIVYHYGINHVKDVMKRGRWVVRDSRLCNDNTD